MMTVGRAVPEAFAMTYPSVPWLVVESVVVVVTLAYGDTHRSLVVGLSGLDFFFQMQYK